jgi:hypothetical protein
MLSKSGYYLTNLNGAIRFIQNADTSSFCCIELNDFEELCTKYAGEALPLPSLGKIFNTSSCAISPRKK